MSARARLRQFLLLAAVVTVACDRDADPSPDDPQAQLLSFDTVTVRLVGGRDTVTVTAELAENEEQRTMGLMERRTLPLDAGMLFVYPAMQPDTSAFWMFRTRIPLDIAFVDSLGVIRTIRTMTPCTTTLIQGCPTYAAGARYVAALEVNAGYFARNRIDVGDRVLLQDTVARRRASSAPIVRR